MKLVRKCDFSGWSVFMSELFCDLSASVSSLPLGQARRGFCGRIDAIAVNGYGAGLPDGELESRLVELGFVEGARVEILHEGAFGRDPIAVRVNDATIALRRREAMAILVS
jgi:ferrous iron transport protein A